MNDALRRGAWDKGCTDIMYVTIKYPNHLIISLLTQPGEVVWICSTENSSCHMGTWTRTLITVTQCVTTELRRPLSINVKARPLICRIIIYLLWSTLSNYNVFRLFVIVWRRKIILPAIIMCKTLPLVTLNHRWWKFGAPMSYCNHRWPME